jgi:flagellar protein FliS
MAANLSNLYDYMIRRLMEGHAANDMDALDEVASLLREIKRGWDAIPDEAINGGEMVKSMVGA